MADDLDIEGLEPTQAVERMRAAYDRQQAAAQKAEQELAQIRAEQRVSDIRAQLREMGAPEQVATLYPADRGTDSSAIKSFLKDSVGFDPDVSSQWANYEARRETGEAPVAEDELVTLERQLVDAMKMDYADTRHLAPTPKEVADMEALRHKVFREYLPQWDADVRARKMGPLVNPQGYGGLIDPPPWADRTQFGIQQAR